MPRKKFSPRPGKAAPAWLYHHSFSDKITIIVSDYKCTAALSLPEITQSDTWFLIVRLIYLFLHRNRATDYSIHLEHPRGHALETHVHAHGLSSLPRPVARCWKFLINYVNYIIIKCRSYHAGFAILSNNRSGVNLAERRFSELSDKSEYIKSVISIWIH